MPNYSVEAKNDMLDALGSSVEISAHTSNPGSTGANECSGSVHATGTFAAASAGVRAQTNSPSITGIPVADTVQFLGVWKTGGTRWYGYQAVTPTSASGGVPWTYDVAAGTLDLNELASA